MGRQLFVLDTNKFIALDFESIKLSKYWNEVFGQQVTTYE